MDLDAYRARAQAFATELNAAHHRRFAGLDARWDPADIHTHHAALFTDDAVAGLRDAVDADPALRPLLRFAVDGRLGAATAGADAKRAEAEARERPGAITAALQAEDDPVRRAALEEQRLEIAVQWLTAPAAQ